jgi:YD repeat-containing protein
VSRILFRSYAYDARGNTTADGVQSYTWNLAGQMTGAIHTSDNPASDS